MHRFVLIDGEAVADAVERFAARLLVVNRDDLAVFRKPNAQQLVFKTSFAGANTGGRRGRNLGAAENPVAHGGNRRIGQEGHKPFAVGDALGADERRAVRRGDNAAVEPDGHGAGNRVGEQVEADDRILRHIHAGADFVERVHERRIAEPVHLGVFAAAVVVGLVDGGAREDVVELVEQQQLPRDLHIAA